MGKDSGREGHGRQEQHANDRKSQRYQTYALAAEVCPQSSEELSHLWYTAHMPQL
jgi:hypothetical protein